MPPTSRSRSISRSAIRSAARAAEKPSRRWTSSAKARFGLVADIITAQLALIRTLQRTDAELRLLRRCASSDEGQFEGHLGAAIRAWPGPPAWYWIRKLQALRLRRRVRDRARRRRQGARRLLWTSPSFFEVAEYHFYAALACAGRYDAAPADERPQRLAALRATWRHAGDLGEELSREFREPRRPGRRRDRPHRGPRPGGRCASMSRPSAPPATTASSTTRRWPTSGRAGSISTAASRPMGLAHLRNARAGYALWGADGKVRQLDELYPQLAAHEPALGAKADRLGRRPTGCGDPDQGLPGGVRRNRSAPADRDADDHHPAECGRRSRPAAAAPRGTFVIEAEARAVGAGVEVRMRRAP